MANAKLEAKAKAASSKSEGMRMLFENGYSVADARDVMGVPYGFAYGVARRAGAISPTPRAPKAEKAKAKAPARAKATATAKPAPRTKAAAKGKASKKAKA